MHRHMSLCWVLCAQNALANGPAQSENAAGSDAGDATINETIVVRARRRSTLDTLDAAAEARRAAALGRSESATSLDSRERAGETTAVRDAVGAMPGALIRSTGGPGGFAMLSVRGAAPGQTLVVVDGVPSSRLGTLTVDLGQFSLAEFATLTLYRSAPPLAAGAAPSALVLETRLGLGPAGERFIASAGAGAFGQTRARLWGGIAKKTWLGAATVGVDRASGDFEYYDNRGTPLNESDDAWQTRRDNETARLDGSARIGTNDQGVAVGLRTSARTQALPGTTTEPSQASLSSRSLTLDASWRTSRGTLSAFAQSEWLTYQDLAGAVGLGIQHRTYRVQAVGVTGWRELARAHIGAGEAMFEGRLGVVAEALRDIDHRGELPLAGHRFDATTGFAGTWARGPWVVQLGALGSLLRTQAIQNRDYARSAPTLRFETPFAPRLSARRLLHDDWLVRASIAQSPRVPTLVEAFGDRGFVVGNPELAAETNRSAELGFAWAPAADKNPRAIAVIDQLLLEGAIFARATDDTIALTSTSALVARAENVGRTLGVGADLSVSARSWRTLRAAASYSFLSSRMSNADPQFADRALPRQPVHHVTARLQAETVWLRRVAIAWASVDAQSGTFLDAANLRRVPARVLCDVGAKFELWPDLMVAVHVSNITNTRLARVALTPPPAPHLTSTPMAVADVAGFPLPGRAVFVSAEWSLK